jgi:hypothetical protein
VQIRPLQSRLIDPMAYLDRDAFATLTVMPAGDVDALDDAAPGWLDVQLGYWSSAIDARLRKRYDAPFAEPYPLAVQGWLARIVTLRAYLRRGVDPLDQQFGEIKADADAAWAEIKEAADSNEGMFDLPLRADTSASGINRGGPYGYSEASPYVWTDVQGVTGRDEDRRRGGSHG